FWRELIVTEAKSEAIFREKEIFQFRTTVPGSDVKTVSRNLTAATRRSYAHTRIADSQTRVCFGCVVFELRRFAIRSAEQNIIQKKSVTLLQDIIIMNRIVF
ncbi:AGAP010084-PA, partial [Anopheles gambiae str. PEST]